MFVIEVIDGLHQQAGCDMTLILSKHFTDCLPIGTAIDFSFIFSSIDELYTSEQENKKKILNVITMRNDFFFSFQNESLSVLFCFYLDWHDECSFHVNKARL